MQREAVHCGDGAPRRAGGDALGVHALGVHALGVLLMACSLDATEFRQKERQFSSIMASGML